MGRKRHGAEQIIAKLREAEVELARGKTAGEICRKPQLGLAIRLAPPVQTQVKFAAWHAGSAIDGVSCTISLTE